MNKSILNFLLDLYRQNSKMATTILFMSLFGCAYFVKNWVSKKPDVYFKDTLTKDGLKIDSNLVDQVTRLINSILQEIKNTVISNIEIEDVSSVTNESDQFVMLKFSVDLKYTKSYDHDMLRWEDGNKFSISLREKIYVSIDKNNHSQVTFRLSSYNFTDEKRKSTLEYQVCVMPIAAQHDISHPGKLMIQKNPIFAERLNAMLWNHNYGVILPHDMRTDQIRTAYERIPIDPNFSTYNANIIYDDNDVMYLVGEGPSDDESFIRLMENLYQLWLNHQDKNITIFAFGELDKNDFIEYFKFRNDHMVKIDCSLLSEFSGDNILSYSLKYNNRLSFKVVHVKSMPDGHAAELTDSDMEILYLNYYSKSDSILFHHCRAGLGRSAEFAFAGILMHLWDIEIAKKNNGLFPGIFSAPYMISEIEVIDRLRIVYNRIREKRPIRINGEQFIQMLSLTARYLELGQPSGLSQKNQTLF